MASETLTTRALALLEKERGWVADWSLAQRLDTNVRTLSRVLNHQLNFDSVKMRFDGGSKYWRRVLPVTPSETASKP